MKLSNKYGGLQFFAGAQVTVIFDSHVKKVSDESVSITTSGGSAQLTGTCTVYMDDGYIIDSVTSTAASDVSNITNSTFYISANSDQTVTITTRAAGGGTVSETWVLNETTLMDEFENQTVNISFSSNGQSFSSIGYKSDYILYYGDTAIYSDKEREWANELYRILTFSESPSGDLLTWLEGNGTKWTSDAHILIFTGHGASFCNVNGASVTFPYALANGDIITFGNNGDRDRSFTINGETASDITIDNRDIAIFGTTVGSGPVITLEYTINYTETSDPSLITVTGESGTYTTEIYTASHAVPAIGDRVPQWYDTWDNGYQNDWKYAPYFGFDVYNADNITINSPSVNFGATIQDQNGNTLTLSEYWYTNFCGWVASEAALSIKIDQLKDQEAANIILLINGYSKAIQITDSQYDAEQGQITLTLPSDVTLPCNFIFASKTSVYHTDGWLFYLDSRTQEKTANTTVKFATLINKLTPTPTGEQNVALTITNQNIVTSGNPLCSACIGNDIQLQEEAILASDSSLTNQIKGTTHLYGDGSDIIFIMTQAIEANRISVDLATAFPDKWAALAPGEHTIQIRAKNPGNYLDSDLSTAITFVKVVNWSINITATNCTADASNPTVVPSNTTVENPVVLKFNKVTGYKLPTTLVLDGIADDGYTWTVSSDGTVGTITITDPSGNITGTVAGTVESYNITVNGTHASKASGPSTITYGGSATLTFTYEDGYFAPASVTVTGATSSWNQSTSTLTLTNCTGAVTVTIAGAVKTYTITPNLTNCSWDDINPSTIDSNQFEAVELVIDKNTGWTLPNEITVSGVDAEYWSWNQATGIVTISHPQGNVTITASATREVYNITTNLTHALAGSGNPTTIGYGLSATLTFTFPTGYEAPSDVTVTGATKSWAAGSGTLTLTNATGNVTVTVVGVATTTTISGQYKWHDDLNLTEWSQDVNFTSDGASFTAMRYTGDGTAMTLQYLDADAEWTTVYNYNEDEGTGSWVNDAYKIVDFGTTAQTVTAIWKADFLANASQLTQLATPQNVTADGTNVSWDEVENATSYEVLADGTSIGTVKTSFVLSARNTEALVDLPYKKDGIVTSSDYDGTLQYAMTPTNIEGIKSYITFGAFGNGDTMPIAQISSMVNCTAEQVTAQVAKLTLTGDASATLMPSD